MRTSLLIAVAAVAGATLLTLQSPARTQEGSARYEIDPVHSSVAFRIGHLGVTYFYGTFTQVDGSFTLADDGGGEARLEVDAASVYTGNEQRDRHLKSPDFFNVKQFPKIVFESTSLEKVGEDYKVKGKLTMTGVTKEITVPMDFVGTGKGMEGEPRAGFHGTFTVDRTDFGIDWRPDVLGTEVWIGLGVEGIRK